ncbi:PREDICTED: uncharacterized protein LOC106123068 [Papilio xuthus]|uniref:Uncharacterized protein LOC106123068 n=1 Tax=Papilio xuthus TaxID=66420 RepID=A0AAJ7EEV0_PAPXU|nr:PREDICTED: uncharacterized protein LOC106123068 [Papilio xuthus]
MTTKSYSKHKEYKEISSRGTVPYTDEQFDMMKSELLPKGSKLDSLGRGTGTREYHYEYKEEKLPGGKYDRKDYHTVEEYTIPARSLPKSSESSSYYYEKEERDIPAITTGTRTYNYETTGTSPGYSKVNTKVTKEMSQNVEELDSLLDDLQKDQERQLYKSGYTSDTAESSSFDYRRGTPVKAPPSSGYSTLKHEERVESSSWGSSPAPAPTLTRAAELRQQMYREEKTESRVVPAVVPAPVALPVPPAVCTHCHQSPGTTGTLPRGGTPMNKVTTTVKTYTYEVPADTDPASVPIPTHADTHTYVCNDTHRTATLTRPVDGSPAPGGCQYCSHCNSRLHYSRTHLSTDGHSYYYEKEERDIPAITTGTRTYNYETTGTSPGYSKVNTKVTKEMSQNVEELDSLLDDLQKDQERQLYKSGYTSDTAESSSFDYRRGTPVKAPPSSGYSTLKHEERVESSSWGSSPAPAPTLTRAAELRQQMYREEKTESRVVPAVVPAPVALPVPPAVCTHCHQSPGSTGTLPRGGTPMNKVTTTVKTYTYEVPADTDPASVPIPTHADTHTYVCNDTHRTATLSRPVDGSPAPGGCQYCSHCNSRLHYSRTHLSTDEHTTTNERMVYPSPANEPHVTHVTHAPHGPTEPHNGHGPYGPTTYKYSETSYSSHNSTLSPPPHAPHTPHRPPKRLDDLLADFPEARFPTQSDGVRRRIETSTRETRDTSHVSSTPTPSSGVKPTPVGSSKNVAGPAVYYPPGHTPFAPKKEVAGYEASAMQGGGAYASGRGMYEYESGARSKEKHYEKKTAVPVCLPLCCAMPCVIL